MIRAIHPEKYDSPISMPLACLQIYSHFPQYNRLTCLECTAYSTARMQLLQNMKKLFLKTIGL